MILSMIGAAFAGDPEAWAAYQRACELGDEGSCLDATAVAPLGLCASPGLGLGPPPTVSFSAEPLAYDSTEAALKALLPALLCPRTTVRIVPGDAPASEVVAAAAAVGEAGHLALLADAHPPPSAGPERPELPPASDCEDVESCRAQAVEAMSGLTPLRAERAQADFEVDPNAVFADWSDDFWAAFRSHDLNVRAGDQSALVRAPAVLLGALAKSQIDAVIRSNMDAIQRCYQQQVSQNPGLEGKLTVKFTITASGAVSGAHEKSSTLPNDAVSACVVGVFDEMVFPEPRAGGVVIVSYPFVFQPS